MDVKRFARFQSPGHAVTGDRRRSGAEKRARVGYDFAHSIADDHSRLAYTELHADQRAATVVAFLERALTFFGSYGIRHLLIRVRRPQTNGKVERYQQTLKREWALGQRYRSSEHRGQALPHWLDFYNERRRHSALGNRPPVSRVRNESRQDS